MQAKRSARDWKSLPEHFGGQAAAAHAEHHRVFETLADELLAQRFEVRNSFFHAIGNLQPAKPIANLLLDRAVGLPQPRVLLRNASDDGGLLQLAEPALD